MRLVNCLKQFRKNIKSDFGLFFPPIPPDLDEVYCREEARRIIMRVSGGGYYDKKAYEEERQRVLEYNFSYKKRKRLFGIL